MSSRCAASFAGFRLSAMSLILMASAAGAFEPDAFTAEQERLLADAETVLAANPDDADALIWKGRRLGYLGRHIEAIAAYESGERLHPKDARFARHIGHRYISLRRFDAAEKAFLRASALAAALPDTAEPDGLPNAAGVPVSSLKGNIWYHLGFAHYLQGEFDAAANGFAGAAALAHNPDAAAAALYWLYLAQRRAGDDAAAHQALARVDARWTLIENGIYHELALCFRGEADCDAILARARAGDGVEYATPAYGIAIHRFLSGNKEGARALFEEIITRAPGTPFGRLAAEAELQRK